MVYPQPIEVDLLLDGMIVDCSTISVAFSANGLATVTFTAYTPRGTGPPYSSDGPGFELCIGGTNFKGWINSMSLNGAAEVADYLEWKVSAISVGCKNVPCNEGC